MKVRSLFRDFSIGAVGTWLILFALVPNLLILVLSFLSRDEHEFFTFTFSVDGYAKIFTSLFSKVFLDSLAMAGLTALLCLLVAYPFALALTRADRRLKPLLLMLVVIPFWTNSLIRTYAMVFILKGKGLLSTLLLALGLIDRPLSLLYTEAAVFIGLVYTLLPFMILPLYASLDKLDGRLLEAARDLGAGRVNTFVHVIWPLTMPGVIAGTMMVFLPALGMFYIPDVLGGGKHLLLGNFIKNQFLTARDWPTGAAASVVLTMMMIGLMYGYWKASKGKLGGLSK